LSAPSIKIEDNPARPWPQVNAASQCECGTPVPQRPHELGTPEHDGALSCPLTDEAKVERRLVNFVEPHLGQGVPCQSLDRTKISLSVPHFSQ